jgi:hypothetical protein
MMGSIVSKALGESAENNSCARRSVGTDVGSSHRVSEVRLPLSGRRASEARTVERGVNLAKKRNSVG